MTRGKVHKIQSVIKTQILLFICVFSFFSAKAQCVYTAQSSDGFEYTTTSPHLISGTVYHLSPQTYAAHTGSRSIYMNFVNTISSNTLVYSRTYTVCANQSYRMSAWFKQTFSGSSTIILRVKDSSNVVLSTSSNTYTAGAWTQWQTTLFTPTTSTIKFELVYSSGFGGNDLSMDDLVLELCNPPVFDNDTISVCSGDMPFNLMDSITTPNSHGGVWSGPSSFANDSLGTFYPDSMSSGTYFYTLDGNSSICPDSIGKIQVIVKSGPEIHLGVDTTLCFGDSILLDASSTGATYVWQDQSTNSTYWVTQPGTYWVTATSNSCLTVDTISIQYLPKDMVNLGNDTSLCQGDTISLDGQILGATYLWQDQSTNPSYLVSQPGTYWVQITVNGCVDSDTIQVDYIPIPNVDLGTDTTICKGRSLLLDATLPGASYVWQDGSTQPLFTAWDEGQYWVTVTLDNCSFTDNIEIFHTNCEAEVEMPNIFTPNGDGVNDFFKPTKLFQVESFSISIYNRWGSEVYTYSGLEPNWDGRDENGAEYSDGVYFYVIQYTDALGQQFELNGDVTLNR